MHRRRPKVNMKITHAHRHAVALMLFPPLFMAACSDADSPRAVDVAPASAPATANVAAPPTVVGSLPAGPTKEAPATTSAVKSDVTKEQQSSAMPLPKQANDDSAPLPAASQRVRTSTP
jgi:hypothetical protein